MLIMSHNHLHVAACAIMGVFYAAACRPAGVRVCSEDTLRLYFSKYGAVEATDIMKDRLSGKSRGFGFVTFVDSAAAAAALSVEHVIDGRRCEAKVALPKVR